MYQCSESGCVGSVCFLASPVRILIRFSQRYGSEDPNPHQDPYQISRIPNTGFQIRRHDYRTFLLLRILGFRAVCQHGSNIPGYWPEENNQLGLLAYHTR